MFFAFNLKQFRKADLYRTSGDRIVAVVVDRIVDTVETERGRSGVISTEDVEWLKKHEIEYIPLNQALLEEAEDGDEPSDARDWWTWGGLAG